MYKIWGIFSWRMEIFTIYTNMYSSTRLVIKSPLHYCKSSKIWRLIPIIYSNTSFKILSFFMLERENARVGNFFNPNYITKYSPKSSSLIPIVLFISIFAKKIWGSNSSKSLERECTFLFYVRCENYIGVQIYKVLL